MRDVWQREETPDFTRDDKLAVLGLLTHIFQDSYAHMKLGSRVEMNPKNRQKYESEHGKVPEPHSWTDSEGVAHYEWTGEYYGDGVGHLFEWKSPDRIHEGVKMWKAMSHDLMQTYADISGGALEEKAVKKSHYELNETMDLVGIDIDKAVEEEKHTYQYYNRDQLKFEERTRPDGAGISERTQMIMYMHATGALDAATLKPEERWALQKTYEDLKENHYHKDGKINQYYPGAHEASMFSIDNVADNIASIQTAGTPVPPGIEDLNEEKALKIQRDFLTELSDVRWERLQRDPEMHSSLKKGQAVGLNFAPILLHGWIGMRALLVLWGCVWLCACTLPATSSFKDLGSPQYGSGFLMANIYSTEIHRPWGPPSLHETHTFSRSLTYKIALPLNDLNALAELKEINAYPLAAGSEEKTPKNVEAERHAEAFQPNKIRWLSKKGLHVGHPLSGESILKMSEEEEIRMYETFGLNETISSLRYNDKGPVSFFDDFFYDMDHKYFIFYPEYQDFEPEMENGSPRELKIFFVEYKTKRYGFWKVPLSYKNPDQWFCSSVKPMQFLSKKGDLIAATLSCNPKPRNEEDASLAYVYDLEKKIAWEAVFPRSMGYKYIFIPERKSFLSLDLEKDLKKSRRKKFYNLTIRIFDVPSGGYKEYTRPVNFIEPLAEHSQ